MVLDQRVRDVLGRRDALAADRGDRVACGQAGVGGGGAGHGAGHGHAGGAAALAALATEAARAVRAAEPAEATGPAETAEAAGPAEAVRAARGADLQAQEGGGADVNVRGGGAGLDLLGDGHCLVDRDRVRLGGRRGLALRLVAGARGGVHPDHLAVGVDQRTARVTGLDGRVGLDQPGQLLADAGQLVRRGDRLVEGGDRPGRDRGGSALALGVAQGGHTVAGLHGGGVAQAGGGQPGGALQLQHRHVVAGVVSDHGGRVGLAVADVGDLDRGGAVDDVVVGEHLAGGRQHDAGAHRGGPLVAVGGHHVDQRRVHPRGDLAGGQRGLGRGRDDARRGVAHAADHPPNAARRRATLRRSRISPRLCLRRGGANCLCVLISFRTVSNDM